MTIYLRSTPSLRKKRMTKGQRSLLEQVNKERRKNGEAPLDSLKAPKLDRENFKSGNKIPDYSRNPRGVSTAHIPSLNTNAGAPASRDTIMDKVMRGEITGKEAEEIIRKSKCLAPAYNKGAVQYIGDPEAARDAGKKTS